MPHNNYRHATGKRYEALALSHLQKCGLTFVASNVRYPVGEIDLIMQEQATWIFIEVRFRRSDVFGGAALSVTTEKRRRLLNAAACWLMEKGESLESADCRFDIFAITGNRVEWIKNAFSE